MPSASVSPAPYRAPYRAPPQASCRAPYRAPGRPPGWLQAASGTPLALERLIHSGSFTASGTLLALELPRRCALPWAPRSQRRRPPHSATWALMRRPLRWWRHRPLPTRRPCLRPPCPRRPCPRRPCHPREHLIEYNRHPPCPYSRHRAPRASQHRPTSCPARRLNAARRQAQRPARRLCVATGALVSVPVPRAAARAYRYRWGAVVSTRMQRAAARAYRYRRCSCATRPCSCTC
jgi:hypothetical protein